MSTLATKATKAQLSRAQEVREHVVEFLINGGVIRLFNRLNEQVGIKSTLEHTPWEKEPNPYIKEKVEWTPS